MSAIFSSSSFTNLQTLINRSELKTAGTFTVKYSKTFILTFCCSISHLLKSSKGRDKLCGVLQYFADFYCVCVKNSNIPEVRNLFLNNMIISAIVALKIKSSMSQARKVFRFLRFFEEIKRIVNTFESKKTWHIKLLLLFSHVMSFLYYIHDNILWGINIGILSDVISEKNQIVWKTRKNSFSLIKVCLNIFKCLLLYIRRKKKENEMDRILYQCPKETISCENKTYDICRAVLRQRQKRRMEALDLFLSILRGIILVKRLKLTSFNLNKIFVSFCGLITSTISLLKILTKNKKDKKEVSMKRVSSLSTQESEEELRKKFKRRLISASSLINTEKKI